MLYKRDVLKNFSKFTDKLRRETSGGAGGGRGGGLPCPFLKKEKKCPDFEKMCPVCVYVWVEILKCNFKSILEKRDQNFSMRGLSSVCHTWNIYRSAPIPRNLPCPKKVLVARLKLKKQSSGSALSKDVLRNFAKFTKNIFAGISFLIKLQGGNLKLSETATGDVQ